MPQLDINVYPSQLFWLIVSFSILYACMHWIITPRIKNVFKKRRYFLEEKLQEVERFREEIEQLEKRIDLLSTKSQKRSAEMLQKTKKECDRLFAEEDRKLQQKTEETLEIFHKKLKTIVIEIEKELLKNQKDFSTFIVHKALDTTEPLEKKGKQ